MSEDADPTKHPDDDETRRRFREALERKKGRRGSGNADTSEPAPHPHTGPAKPQRTFRRKSG